MVEWAFGGRFGYERFGKPSASSEFSGTPTCSFNSYLKNASSGAHYDIGFFFGDVEGNKTIVGIQVDPYEDTYTSDDTHQFIYNVNAGGGNANYYHFPFVNPLSGDHQKQFGLDPVTWGSSWTTVSGTVDISGDWTGSGALANISVPNTGSVWTPPSASGSNVWDIPATHYGSIVLVNQATDWDLDPAHKIHNWCPIQIHVGHAVQVSNMTLASGTIVNNSISVYGIASTAYTISFKVYHASPKEWEWYSGSTLVSNGTIAGHTKGIWDFINTLAVGQQAGSGTYPYTLKLYTASGTYLHPDRPVRTMSVSFIIP